MRKKAEPQGDAREERRVRQLESRVWRLWSLANEIIATVDVLDRLLRAQDKKRGRDWIPGRPWRLRPPEIRPRIFAELKTETEIAEQLPVPEIDRLVNEWAAEVARFWKRLEPELKLAEERSGVALIETMLAFGIPRQALIGLFTKGDGTDPSRDKPLFPDERSLRRKLNQAKRMKGGVARIDPQLINPGYETSPDLSRRGPATEKEIERLARVGFHLSNDRGERTKKRST